MSEDCIFDALVVGAGPAGSATAIFLARAGWSVALAEQHVYPRRKVCGECMGAGSLAVLDDLGVGDAVRAAAGPELRRVGWMDATGTVDAAMPACTGPYAYGRALGRDRLDELLLQRARSVGVAVLQPVTVREVAGGPGRFECTLELRDRRPGARRTLRARAVVDAHGSWERGPLTDAPGGEDADESRKGSDLFAFKANYRRTRLAPGFLPVLAFPGGYGGMVVAEGGRTTVACCIRRDALTAVRGAAGARAGLAVEALLRASCAGVRVALEHAERDGAWLSVGKLRPGIRLAAPRGIFRVGNAAGESHPLIGEGISMALQSAGLLAARLLEHRPAALQVRHADAARAYAGDWRRAFAPRLKLAALYAHIAMRPVLADPARALLQRWPGLLYGGARLAGKATGPAIRLSPTAEAA